LSAWLGIKELDADNIKYARMFISENIYLNVADRKRCKTIPLQDRLLKPITLPTEIKTKTNRTAILNNHKTICTACGA
jgi:hypothetical protein